MSSSGRRDKILHSWSKLSEVSLIKDVATKGDDIELCIKYGARKRKLSLEDYELFFNDVVLTYVQQLLSERDWQKAEQVLLNVKLDVRCVYFQYACECGNDELSKLLLEHLTQSEKLNFPQAERAILQENWECLKVLRSCPDICEKFKGKLRRLNLTTLVNCDAELRKRLDVELYFATRNSQLLLPRLDKLVIFEFLVEMQNVEELVRWHRLMSIERTNENAESDLEVLYCRWPWEPPMYEHALKTLKTKSGDVLRYCFAQAGYFFDGDCDNVPLLLKYICTTQSFAINENFIRNLPLGKFLMEREYSALLLNEFVNISELENLGEQRPDQRSLLTLIIDLKRNKLSECDGFIKIAQSVTEYFGGKDDCDQPLLAFHKFLCEAQDPSILLHDNEAPDFVPQLTYLSTLAQRMSASRSRGGELKMPTPYNLLLKYNNVDVLALQAETLGTEGAPFTSAQLRERYAYKYERNFLHYLKQYRSSYAVYYLITECLHKYSQLTHTQLYCACEAATELALQYASDKELVVHCVAFIEMLGFNSHKLRCFVNLSDSVSHAADGVCRSPCGNVVSLVEHELMEKLAEDPSVFPLKDYEALMQIVETANQLPDQIMRRYAATNDWWQLLVLWQYFEIPLQYVRHHCKLFSNRIMGEHLLRALSYESQANERNGKWRQSKIKYKSENLVGKNVSVETIPASKSSSCNDASIYFRTFDCNHRYLPDPSIEVDIFALVLLSTSSMPEERIASGAKFLEFMQDNHLYATSINLMRNAVKFRQRVLSVLAATINAQNLEWNWLVWLAIAIDQWHEVTRTVAQHADELSWQLIEYAVRNGHTNALYCSFCIFYKDNPFVHFLRFLQQTQNEREFGEAVAVSELRAFLLAASAGEVLLPLHLKMRHEQLMLRIVKLLLIHLEQNFDTTMDQQRFLECICNSDFCDICSAIDFCQLSRIFAIIQHGSLAHDDDDNAQPFVINFEALLQQDHHEYTNLLNALVAAEEYDAAVRLSSLLSLPISDIIYAKWVSNIDTVDSFSCEHYENEIAKHALPPELLVNFFLYAASLNGGGNLEQAQRKYRLFKCALTVIKKHHLFPNESFDRDQIEYEMIVAYLLIGDADCEVDVGGGEEHINGLSASDVYHSEYYEQIMICDRRVLYKSFLELKELAGVDDITVSERTPLTAHMQQRLEALLHHLLDAGDIVEALRLQELFECRPLDLRFIVFCMALAEDITSISNMSLAERKLLREIELSSFAKFNKRTLMRNSGSRDQAYSSSPSTRGGGFNEFSDSASTLEFEEIPSKEKQETLETLQGIASKLKHGVDLGKRIVMAYRAAMYLDKEYLDVLRTKDISILLKSISEEGCLHRLLVISDILTSTHMTAEEIAELLAYEITVAVIRPRFYIFSADQQSKNTFQNAELWGHNLDRDFHLFLELTPNTTCLGNYLLDYCDALKTYRRYQDQKSYTRSPTFEKLAEIITCYGQPPPASPSITSMMSNGGANSTAAAGGTATVPQVLSHKKQNLIYVELLIKANQCFVHECCMEGIANVLARAKSLNTVLAQAKSWSLLVRMLIGIARYREMYYCFDVLIENDQFESLLGQFDEEKAIGLRQAIIAYLREYQPNGNGHEFLKLAAVHFLMYKDLAEMWESDARNVLATVLQLALVDSAQLLEQNSMNSLTSPTTGNAKVLIPKLCVTADVMTMLHQALENYTHATENYLSDSKLLLAQKTVALAEMVAMQLDLAQKASERTPPLCVCVINVQTREEFRELVNSELSVPQALILSRSCGYDVNWSEALFLQFVVLQRKSYLNEYLAHLRVNDALIHNIVKNYQLYVQHHKTVPQMEHHLAQMLELMQSITLKYKLASLLGVKSIVMTLINDQTVHYLRDTNYGRNDCDI